jgi:hypothetical protein
LATLQPSQAAQVTGATEGLTLGSRGASRAPELAMMMLQVRRQARLLRVWLAQTCGGGCG